MSDLETSDFCGLATSNSSHSELAEGFEQYPTGSEFSPPARTIGIYSSNEARSKNREVEIKHEIRSTKY